MYKINILYVLREFIFFYGTLRKGYPHNPHKSLIDSLQFVNFGTIEGDLYDIGSYPGAIKRKGKGKIVGDVFLLDNPEEVLNLLDKYEGYSSHKVNESEFMRTRCRVSLNSGENLNAWVYLYNLETGDKSRIKSGDYLIYLNKMTTNE